MTSSLHARGSRDPSEPPPQDPFGGFDVGFLWLDASARVRRALGAPASWFGLPAGGLAGQTLFEIAVGISPEDWASLVATSGACAVIRRLRPRREDGSAPVLEARLHRDDTSGEPGIAMALLPIDDRVEAEAIDGVQHQVLESIAVNASLATTLDLLCRRVELAAGTMAADPSMPPMVCSVLLVRPDGTLDPVAGPGLPPDYVEALRGARIGPRAGSCGTAAWRGQPVEVIDIATDPLWEDYRYLLPLLGMAACWSSPIISMQGDVVATFALYYPQARAAPPFHRRMVEACVPLCRVAIEHESNRAQIERLAYFDPLTGLPNRRLFADRASQSVQLAARLGTGGALMLLDIDRFKTTNDSLGQAAGDEVLRETARRLVRELGDDVTVARLGGDEFAALLPGRGPMEAMHVAERVRRALAEPLAISGLQLALSASVGLSVFPADGRELAPLLRNAEMAMYEAKRGHRSAPHFFKRAMNEIAEQRLQMESALRAALAQNRLALHYQPKIRLDAPGCAGVEALVRWDDPHLGPVPPDRFIPLAEETGLVIALDAWVLETACAQLARWRRQGIEVPAMAVNVSPYRFRQDDVPAHVRRVLERHGLPFASLVLEITERVLLSDDERSREDLRKLHQMGVGLSVDDFGTGYSSLGYLKRLPVTELKLDKSFVHELGSDAGGRALAAAVLGIGNALGLDVVAEGVETLAQRDTLAQLGCKVAQGFLFTRALPPAALAAWLEGPGQRWTGRPVHGEVPG